jgi:glutamyl-tRNA synthetase
MAEKLGYATNNADFKKEPEKYKGNTAKVCEYIRIAITGRKNSPDLFEIMSLLGEQEVLDRIEKIA